MPRSLMYGRIPGIVAQQPHIVAEDDEDEDEELGGEEGGEDFGEDEDFADEDEDFLDDEEEEAEEGEGFDGDEDL